MTRRLWAVTTASLLVACGGESGPNGIDVDTIQVTPNPVALAQQESVQLHVTAFDDNGALLAGVPVSFTSKNENVITVSSSGLVKSVGPAGVTSITLKAGGKTTVVPVTVNATGQIIRVLPTPASVPQMGTLQLDVALLDILGSEIPGENFTFASSNPSIATVSETGLVTSVGPAGQVEILVSTGGMSTQKTVTVVPTPTSISLSPNPVTLGRAAERPLVATVLDLTGSPIADPAITYSAQPASLLEVSGAGVLTSKGTPGTGTVTAAAGTLSVTVPVTILNVGTLAGTISGSVSVPGQPYGVALGAGNAFYGVGSGGSFDVGTFGSTAHTSSYISAPIMTGVAFSPTNGLVYAAGNTTDGLMEIDPASSTILRRWEAPDQMYDVAISQDGSQIYVAGSPDRLYVISAATMTLVKDLPTGGSVVHLFADPLHPLVYTSGGSLVREINVTTGATRAFDFPGAQATALAIAGDKLFIGGEGQTLGIVDLTTGLTTTVSVPCQVYDLVAAPDGVQLLATCSLQGKALLLDAYTFEIIQTIQTNGTPRRAAITSDGTGAVIANAAGSYTFVE